MSDESDSKDEAYLERDLAVLGMIRVIRDGRSALTATENQFDYGYRHDENYDSEDWVVVWIEHEEFGQMGWHMKRSRVDNVDWLKYKEKEYDGHSREEKLERLKELIDWGDNSEK